MRLLWFQTVMMKGLKRFGRASILMVCVAAVSCGERDEPPRAVVVAEDGQMQLKLMTFNLRYENPRDVGERSWRMRIRHVVRVIAEESPDVLGVQEALHGQVADLRASLPEYGFYGVGRDDGLREGEYTALFFRKDRFEVDDRQRGTIWLSDEPAQPGSATWGNEIPRVAAWMRLIDRTTSRGFWAFNTHWDHRHQGSREKAAGLLAREVSSRSDEPVVLLGDFNATGRNVAVTSLQEASGLVETFQALHPQRRDRTTLHFWKNRRAGSLKVDHILVSGGAEVLEAAIRDGDEPMVSDHFPVTARVVFPDDSQH